ncbi:DUF4332 domain-containing protein [Candidatus Woesearchaeota archaeon]|nr:DUF4332 domain-containing protein [Candidatus Woesearchaeota archaeon]
MIQPKQSKIYGTVYAETARDSIVKKDQHKTKQAFLPGVFIMLVLGMVAMLSFAPGSASAISDTTNPTIISVSPMNNEKSLFRDEQIAVVFSEDMNPSTINERTISLIQRTTPETGGYNFRGVDATVTYAGRTATLIPNEMLTPNQGYGNVFTVFVSTGVEDKAGNQLSRVYISSFTTGGDWFNTDVTTSQSNQSAAVVSIPATVPATPPITNAPMTLPVTSSSSWLWWTLGGLLATILAVSMLALFVKIKPAATKSRSHKSSSAKAVPKAVNPYLSTGIRAGVRTGVKSSMHPVMSLEGIGPKYSRALQEMGILDTYQLWKANPVKVAQQTGAPLSSVVSWQNMAELASVKDIGPQYAELLERSGIHSIDQLKSYNANKLLNLVQQKQDSLNINIQGNTPGMPLVENWIDQAREHNFNETGKGLA